MSKQSDLVSVSQGASGDPLYIDTTNDRVGIGTSSPDKLVHLKTAVNNTAVLRIESTATDSYPFLSIKNDAREYQLTAHGPLGDVFTIYDGTAGSHRFVIDSGGQIFAGCTSTSGGVPNEDGIVIQPNGNAKFRVASSGNAANQYYSYLGVNVGSITVGTSSTNFNTSSDYRLKENVTPLSGAADRLAQIPVHRFNFIVNPDTTVDGFLAHEVQAFVPEAVTGSKDAMRDEEYEVTPAAYDDEGNLVSEAVMGTRSVPDYQGIDQSKLVPLLTAALQEALQKIDALEARVATLEGN